MIEKIALENFKCFARAEVLAAPLTLISGVNGVGKSSVLQAILLVRQSLQQGILDRGRAALNGELVQLGTARDILYENAEQERIIIEITREGGAVARWDFQYAADAQMLEASAPTLKPSVLDTEPGRFHYLCAERIGPRTASSTSDHHVKVLRELGVRGEFAVQFLSVYGDEKVEEGPLRHPEGESASLNQQLEAWLDVVSPGTRLRITAHPGMDLVQLQFQFASELGLSNDFRPTNVGFGLSSTVPVLAAVLGAKPGALVLLENPEAHLHPRGQLQMGRFLALAAASGRQIILETHSDHLLNGVRLAVHGGEIDPSKVALHYVERPTNGGASEVVSPRIDRDGRIDRWPAGFFDEWDNALDRLLTPATR